MNSKYLKYAFGEIFLVVIGILIALSISNWNEERKDKLIEEEIVSEMLNSLRTDSARFQMLQGRMDIKDSAIQTLMDLSESGNYSAHEDLGYLIGSMQLIIAFSYDAGPYQALVSLGINKMRNKELLQHIIYYYNIILPRGDNFLQNVMDQFQPEVDKHNEYAYAKGYAGQQMVKNDSGKWVLTWKEIDHNIFEDDFFEAFVIANVNMHEGLTSRLAPIIQYNKELIELLEAY